MSDDANPTLAGPGHWRATVLVASVVLGAYALLLSPNWTPGGDSEMFISAARSIIRGEGYSYNGRPVYVAPPAWSYVMAAAMWVSPTFLTIKLVSVTLMTAAWVMAHRVMLRLGPAHWATWAAIFGGLLVPVYSLTFWLHSEPLFCALSWGAALMAVRVSEDRRRMAEVLGVIVLCGLMGSVRWTSGLQWGVIAAILAGGWRLAGARAAQKHGWDRRITLGIGLSGLATVLVLIALYLVIPTMAGAVTTTQDPDDASSTVQDAEDAPPGLVDNSAFKELSPWEERLYRLGASGHWPAWTLWYPLRFAGGMRLTAWISLAGGWTLIVLMVLAAYRSLVREEQLARWSLGRFVWPALVGYLFLLVFIWPLPNARYLVPVAPLLILAVLWGCVSLGEATGRPRLARTASAVFLASVGLANLPMYVVDVRTQRRADEVFGGGATAYYADYEAGLHLSLLQAIAYLREREVADYELAVSERYSNLNRMRFSKAGPRNVVMLLDRRVVTPPIFYSFVPREIPEKLYSSGQVLPGGFAEWAALKGVKYYLYQQPTEPWRLWHFRLSESLESRLSGRPPEPPSFGWLLFTSEDGFRNPIPLTGDVVPVRRIPGL